MIKKCKSGDVCSQIPIDMIQYSCESQHITKETSNLPQQKEPIFRCAYAILFYPSNGYVFR